MVGESQQGLNIALMGPMRIVRDGVSLPIPASRKSRAIFGYLVLSPRPVARQRLCDLFFDVPDDPRASLRWTLTKLRGLVDDSQAKRIVAERDSVAFAPLGANIDALELLRGQPSETIEHSGVFLEDAELPDRQDFMIWLYGVRDELRSAGATHLRGLLSEADISQERRLALFRKLLLVEPLDEAATAGVILALSELGRVDAARDALSDAERNFRRAGKAMPASIRNCLRAPAQQRGVSAGAQPKPSPVAQVVDPHPCVAIAPFQNYSPDLITDSMMNEFLESTIHLFSRFRNFRLLSFNDALALKGGLIEPASIHAQAGAHYVIGGSVISKAQSLKVRYRIVDAQSGVLLRSGDIENASVTPAAMYEDIPAAFVPHLFHQCIELVRAKAAEIPKDQRSAVEHYYCGLSDAFFAIKPDFGAALQSFQAAMAIDPNYAPAMAAAVHCKATLLLAHEDPDRSHALELAHAAIALANGDAFSLSLAAWGIVHIGRDVDPALRAVDLAIRLNPLSRIAWNISAWVRAMNGEYEMPMAHWVEAEKCNPLGASVDTINSGRALCCWMAGEYEASLSWAKRSLERVPNNPGGLTAGLASAVMLQDRNALTQMAARLRQYYPQGVDSPIIAAVPIISQDKREQILTAVQRGLSTAAGG